MVFCPGCTWSTSLHRCIGLLREGVAVRASLVADCIAQHRCIVFSAQTQFILGCIASDFFICLVQHVTMSHETGGVVLCSDESYCGRTLHFVLQRCTVALSTWNNSATDQPACCIVPFKTALYCNIDQCFWHSAANYVAILPKEHTLLQPSVNRLPCSIAFRLQYSPKNTHHCNTSTRPRRWYK